METVRYRVIYEGRVQGVGFRYTTASIAKPYPVSGYVKNLRDGTVEVQVEGPREPVDAFLQEIAAHLKGISRIARSRRPRSTNRWKAFISGTERAAVTRERRTPAHSQPALGILP